MSVLGKTFIRGQSNGPFLLILYLHSLVVKYIVHVAAAYVLWYIHLREETHVIMPHFLFRTQNKLPKASTSNIHVIRGYYSTLQLQIKQAVPEVPENCAIYYQYQAWFAFGTLLGLQCAISLISINLDSRALHSMQQHYPSQVMLDVIFYY